MAIGPDIWKYFSSRRVLARLLSTVLCSILLVIRPFSELGGPSAFLALTVKELVFSVQENLAQEVEATILHLTGGLIAIGISILGKFFVSLLPVGSAAARTVPAVFLVSICFLAGWAKSRLPRLTLSSRIACFMAIWLLTTDVGVVQYFWPLTGYYIWIMLVAAVTSLLSSMLLLHWSSTQFAREVASCFSQLNHCLSLHIHNAFSELQPVPIREDIYKNLLRRSIALDTVYQQAAFELRVGRLNVKLIKPFIGIVEHLRRELSWGMSFPRPSHLNSPSEAHIIHSFRVPALELGHAILESMSAIEKIVLGCFEHSIPTWRLESQTGDLMSSKHRLSTALIAAREELRSICDDWDMEQRASEQQISFPEKIFDLCSFMISLLQMAHDLQHAVEITEEIISVYRASSLRLWYPRFTLAWLGAKPSSTILDERGIFLDQEFPDLPSRLSQDETKEGLAEHRYGSKPNSGVLPPTISGRPFTSQWYQSLGRFLWNHQQVINARLLLSNFIRSVEHSPHLRHAFKNAAGVALLSIPAFMSTSSPAHDAFKKYYGQWMLISYVWVLETNTGATWRVAYLRISGTIIGAFYACIAALICRTNPFGLVAMVALSEIPISYVVIKTSFPSLGIVASVTLPPILFLHYFQPMSSMPNTMIAVFRSVMIAMGIVAALLMNSMLFPRHCRVMFLDSACETLGLLSQLYMGLSRDLFHHASTSHYLVKRKSLKLEHRIRLVLHRMSVLLVTMDDELSLVPKPMRRYRETTAVLQKLLDLLTGIRKVRENIPRKETVEAVVSQRREFVSCVCVSFFACEQVFRARQPLPQFLPSTRVALNTLENDVEQRIRQSRQEATDSLGLSVIYAFAEIDTLRDLVDTIDNLLDLSRQLFGTSTWFNDPVSNNTAPVAET